ncbi:MAG: alpha/beta fold hydrolase [Acidimicrobiia bacterium]
MQARNAYATAYSRTLSFAGVDVRERDVETSVARTHIVEAGEPGRPPIVLLHSFTFSSTVWVRNLAALSAEHYVVAIDEPGDSNLSVLNERIRSIEDYRPWFSEVLDAVGIAGATPVVGNSIGGWMGISLAVGLPDRITKLALISPASLARFGWGLFKTIPIGLVARTPPRKAAMLRHFLLPSALAGEDGEAWAEQYGLIAGFKPVMRSTPMIGRHRDETLRSIPVPVLLIEGEHEPLYDPRKAYERGRRLIPNVQAHLLDGVGHVSQMEDPERVNGLLLDFLG